MDRQAVLEQVALDLEEARERLEALGRVIARKDEAEAEVRELTQKLRQAKRRAREATWELATLLGRERRETSARRKT